MKKIYSFKSDFKLEERTTSNNNIIPSENARFFETFKGKSSSFNFILNDYLGLSKDERVKCHKSGPYGHGYEVSSNVATLSDKAEEYLSCIFSKPVLLFANKEKVHTDIMLSFINVRDAVIFDRDVHSSIRVAVDSLKNKGVHVEIIEHNQVQALEDKVKYLAKKCRKIWYLADSIYPMRGDAFPADEIQYLLDTYEQFYLYIDDSKGLSWTGENGKGYVYSRLKNFEKLILFASLNKGFGCEGGLLVCYDEDIKEQIIQNSHLYKSKLIASNLESIIESAKIHLSNEIYSKQVELKNRVFFFNKISLEFGLPIVSSPDIPTSFFAMGLLGICQEICFNLLKIGYYLNIANFPMVPDHGSGIMANVTLWQSKTNIKEMLRVFSVEYHKALKRRCLETYDVLLNYHKHTLIY